MTVCTRPLIADLTIAGRDIARCETCGQVSAPGGGAVWAEDHRVSGTGRMNECARCKDPIGLAGGVLCDRCSDIEWDKWLDRHDDIRGSE